MFSSQNKFKKIKLKYLINEALAVKNKTKNF